MYFQIKLFRSLSIVFYLCENVDPDEMLHHAIWIFSVCQGIHLQVSHFECGDETKLCPHLCMTLGHSYTQNISFQYSKS